MGGVGIIEALREVVGDDAVVTDPDLMQSRLVDWTGRYRGITPAVVFPSTTAETAEVVRVCREFAAPWVPQGGNTGLVGGGIPVDGEVVISTGRLRSIGPIDESARQITVGAGVTLSALDDHLAPHGLHYGVDFGARESATIGGTVATNAGGTAVLRYGMTRDQLVGIEAVLPDGSVISRLSGLAKDNTGYDLASLLCGSEGTLGIITAARLTLRARHLEATTAAFGLESIDDALVLLASLRNMSGLEHCEVMRGVDVSSLCEIRGWSTPPVWKATWCVLAEINGAGALDAMTDAAERSAAVLTTEASVALRPADRAAWWSIRDTHPEIAGHFGTVVKLDVSVPLHALSGFVDGLEAEVVAAAPSARLVVFGHLGDGNLHVNGGLADSSEIEAFEDVVLQRVLAMGGSISAEHGIGRLKRDWLVRDRGAAAVIAMRRIKAALDPDGLANPHVLLPDA